MSEQQTEETMGHEVDGIGELDNLLPRWWVWLFWLATVFAAAYLLYYHVLYPGKGSAWEYKEEIAEADRAMALLPPTPTPDEASTEAAVVAKGKQIFMANCIPCHGTMAQGIVGPNLTDDYWIHGGKFANIKHTITEGVPAKGMLTWKLTLRPMDIYSVASYVWSLHGSDVSKASPPPKPVEPEAKLEPRT